MKALHFHAERVLLTFDTSLSIDNLKSTPNSNKEAESDVNYLPSATAVDKQLFIRRIVLGNAKNVTEPTALIIGVQN